MSLPLLDDPILRDLPVSNGWKVLGPVVIERKLGQGGMGAVYKGRHLRLNCPVAVKLMSQHLAANAAQFAERFRREAQVAVTLNHPNLVRCFDVNTEYSINYMILEFIHGEDAGRRVKRRGTPGLPEKEACAILAAATAGLAEAHRRNIVHRDIKPENIMIDHTGRVVLMDLGLAKVIEDTQEAVTVTGQAMGTPNYMSPEQWDDAKSAALPSDIWALGVSLYCLATGSLPWSASGMGLLMKKVQNEPMTDPRSQVPGLSAPFIALLERCLHKDPAQRILAADLHRELKVLGGENFDLTDPAIPPLEDTRASGTQSSPSDVRQRTPTGEKHAPSSTEFVRPSEGIEGPTVELSPALGNTDPTLISDKQPVPSHLRIELQQVHAQYGCCVPPPAQLQTIAQQLSAHHKRSFEPSQVATWLTAIDREYRARNPAADGAWAAGDARGSSAEAANRSEWSPKADSKPGSSTDWGRPDIASVIQDLVRQRMREESGGLVGGDPDALQNFIHEKLRAGLGYRLNPTEDALAATLIRDRVAEALRAEGVQPAPGCWMYFLHPMVSLVPTIVFALVSLGIAYFAEKESGVSVFMLGSDIIGMLFNVLGIVGYLVFRSRYGYSSARYWAFVALVALFWLGMSFGCMSTFFTGEEFIR